MILTDFKRLPLINRKTQRNWGSRGFDFVLSVGELNKNKNHETVIKAIAKLNNPNVHYVICGQGVLEDYLKQLIKRTGVRKPSKASGISKRCR